MFNSLKNKIKYFFVCKNIHDYSIVLVENIISKGLNFLLIVIVARHLDPANYGVYSLVVVAMLFLMPFLDFGMENTAIVYSGKYKNEKEKIFGLYLYVKLTLLLVFCSILYFIPNLVSFLVDKSIPRNYIFIILLSVIIESLLFVFTTYLQSSQRFLLRASINIGNFAIKLLSVWILLKLGITSITLMSLFIALSGVAALFLSFRKLILFLRSSPFSLPLTYIREIFNYEKWMFVGSVSVNLMTRIDFFFVAYYFTTQDVGLYNSAFQLIAPFTMISVSFGKVFLPKVSSYNNINQVKEFLKKSILFNLIVTFLVSLTLLISKNIIFFIFGEKYIGAARFFPILLISYLIGMWTSNLSLIFYLIKKPKYIVVSSYIQMIAFIILGICFNVKFGVLGIAWARMLSNVALFISNLCYLIHSLRNHKRFFNKKNETVLNFESV